jgi:subtilase family serine protease
MASVGRPRALALVLASLAVLVSAPAAHATSGTEVAGTQPGWATPDNHARDEPGSDRMVFSVWLDWRNAGQLNQLLADQQNPASPAYQQWLSSDEFRARFAPTQAAYDDVATWLTNQGFDVLSAPKNRLSVSAEGTVAQVERAFQVNEGLYHLGHGLVRGPSHEPRIPVALADSVRAITGLDGAMSLARPRSGQPAPPPPIGRSVGPCSHYWGERSSRAFPNPFAPGRPLPWIVCGYTPSQVSSAYGASGLHSSGIDGRGQTIVITGAFHSPTITIDAEAFSHRHHLPSLHGLYTSVVAPGTTRYPKNPEIMQNWYTEQSLDVEWAHAIAPQARITYVEAANDARGLDLAVAYAVDNHLGNVISNSWGMPEAWASNGEIHVLNAVFQQAAATGIGVYFASGDDGDNAGVVGHRSAGFPDSSPLVTSVGGTSLGIGKWGTRLWESGWGTTNLQWDAGRWHSRDPLGDFIYGGGGGTSHVFAQPAYQAGIVPTPDATWKGNTMRAEPDVALVADPQTGAVFTESYSLPNGNTKIVDSWIGGTSLAAPLMAGIAAMADQQSGRAHGFLNPQLYGLAGSSSLQDIVPSNGTLAVLRNGLDQNGQVLTRLRGIDRDSSLVTAPGWDPVTGLGSPNVPLLLSALR